MSEPIRLFIVTDDPDKACLAVIGFHRSELPPFIRIVMDADEIRSLPEGARCIGQWFQWGARRHDGAQLAWMERKDRGGLEGMTEAFYQRLEEWASKRRETEARILAEAVSELSDGRVIPYSEFSNAHAAAHAVASEKVAVMPNQSRWS
ncbi:hypothetical protein ASC97_04165 [Rhizobium sp. Root1203]|uniref:hypothetical protein n=1 Tax=Rhizobium sp. Root1203 TaxID=1736427 RepID=UPI00070F8DA0|nr:hypothetical protein [Rhizobium sp. Root1203]KQV27581.1 hypothetical protein ASC97_04165 [Rhizobium sp. Root1203]